MRSCVNMQLAYYLGTIAESLCHIFGMPSSKFNEIVAAFSCQGNRARSAVRMSRRSLSSALLASSTPVRVEREEERERESHQSAIIIFGTRLFAQALPSPQTHCLPPPKPCSYSLHIPQKTQGAKVGQLHRQCGMKFELSSAC